MCDTLLASPDSTRNGVMILAKNSDREPNEAQNITFVPAAFHPAGMKRKCTYIEVDQVPYTGAVLLSRPFWMFGGEMGVNEYGVAIGNEAVFTREKYSPTGLTGMDILRLALERGKTAREALEISLYLLDRYGQGGNGGYQSRLNYHNSFLIADAGEGYILETAGRKWVSRSVTGVASISNCLTLEEDYTESFLEEEEPAGASPDVRRVSFAARFSDSLFTRLARGRERRAMSLSLLREKQGALDSGDIMGILRHHGDGSFRPGRKPMERLCLHAGGLVSTQTTGSMVALLKEGRPPLVYLTGTSAPCLSLYKPHTLLPGQNQYPASEISSPLRQGERDVYGSAGGRYDPSVLWWAGEEIHRRALMNYPLVADDWRRERDVIEGNMRRYVEEKWQTSSPETLQETCLRYAQEFVEIQMSSLAVMKKKYDDAGGKKEVPFWYQLYWKRMNRKAGFP